MYKRQGYLNAKSAEIDKLASRFKVHFDEVEPRIEKILEENKELQKELEETKAEMAKSKFATFVSKAQDIEGGKLFITKIENLDADAVKAGIEMLSNKLGESIIVLANERMVIVKVTDGFVKKGINAGKIVGEIARATGANGGGRPNFAQGGVKDASKPVSYTHLGYDALLDRYTDMFAAGIVDPAKVTRSALENAASVGSMLLTTQAAVVDIPEESKAPDMSAMAGMGGMGGMM